MDHPSSRLCNELSSGLPALGFVGDGALEAELSAADATSTAIGRETNIHVGMPSRDAQRNALVQLILGLPRGAVNIAPSSSYPSLVFL